jgi:hypothetical protein
MLKKFQKFLVYREEIYFDGRKMAASVKKVGAAQLIMTWKKYFMRKYKKEK